MPVVDLSALNVFTTQVLTLTVSENVTEIKMPVGANRNSLKFLTNAGKLSSNETVDTPMSANHYPVKPDCSFSNNVNEGGRAGRRGVSVSVFISATIVPTTVHVLTEPGV